AKATDRNRPAASSPQTGAASRPGPGHRPHGRLGEPATGAQRAALIEIPVDSEVCQYVQYVQLMRPAIALHAAPSRLVPMEHKTTIGVRPERSARPWVSCPQRRISHVGIIPSVTMRDRDSRHRAVRDAATAQVTVTADQDSVRAAKVTAVLI